MKQKKAQIPLFILAGVLVLGIILYLILGINGNDDKEANLGGFNQCLADKGVIVYGSKFCPACKNLVETLGGYESASPVYVECTENQLRCQEEAKTGYVPEIQIKGEVYQGQRTLEGLGSETGCQIPN